MKEIKCCHLFQLHSIELKTILYKPKRKLWVIPTRTCSDDDSGLIIDHCPFCGAKLKSGQTSK